MLSSGELSTGDIPGVKPVAMWRDGRVGSVLFLTEPDTGLFPFEFTSLNHEDAELVPVINRWRSAGSGGVGIHTELASAPGLQKLGGGTNRQIRLTIGHAGADVARIELSNGRRRWSSPVGIDGFFLLGTRLSDPVTTAIAIASDGSAIAGSEIVL
jgi:hypothetical protein